MIPFWGKVGSNFIIVFSIITFFVLPGCDSQEKFDQLDDTVSDIKQTLGDIAQKFQKQAPSTDEIQSMTQEELEKLSTFEYKVEDFNKSMSAANIESSLKTLGKDRWECFQVLEFDEKIRVFCKRLPKTYLRYIPRIF